MKNLLNIFLIGITALCSWNTDAETDTDVREHAEHWLSIYAERKDWEAFLNCYSDDMKFIDERVRRDLDGKQAFAEFYDWPDERFRLADPSRPALEVHQLVIEGRTAVARGKFLPFYWGEELFDVSDEFVFWLKFNEAGKIVEQRDYIPYPKRFLPDE